MFEGKNLLFFSDRAYKVIFQEFNVVARCILVKKLPVVTFRSEPLYVATKSRTVRSPILRLTSVYFTL